MEIIKFGKKGCAPCAMVENLLKESGIDYVSVDVEENPEMAADNEVFFSVPVTILKDGDEELGRLTGFNPDILNEFINKKADSK